MGAFPTGFIELAFKRSVLRRQDSLSEARLLSLVKSVLGDCRVNFDAEGLGDRPSRGEVEALCAYGFRFSETYQAGCCDLGYLEFLGECYRRFREFGLNFVLGNTRYGCIPSVCLLEEKLSWFASNNGCYPERVKVGVEGERLGSRVLGLCERFGLTAYILNTPWMGRLVDRAKRLGVKSVIYTPVRVSEDPRSALCELFEIMGQGYFERRGIRVEEIHMKASGYVIYGSPEDVVSKLSAWGRMGVCGVVLSPVFAGLEDLSSQLRLLMSVVDRLHI